MERGGTNDTGVLKRGLEPRKLQETKLIIVALGKAKWGESTPMGKKKKET